jgi:hypothetical protein
LVVVGQPVRTRRAGDLMIAWIPANDDPKDSP